jgi:hypothetical protein
MGVGKSLNLSGGTTRLQPGRPRIRQHLWTSYLEQSEGVQDRWTETCSGRREWNFVMMLLLCDNVSEKYIWSISFHYPSAIFILGDPRSSICYRMYFPVVSFIMDYPRVLLIWPSYSLPCLLSHEINIIPVIVDSVTLLTAANRAWILIVWELILHGRKPWPRTCSNYAGKNWQFHVVSRHLSFQLRNLIVFWRNDNQYVDKM